MQDLALGIDIGGTNTSLGLVNKRGDILARASLLTTESELLDVYIQKMADTAKDLMSNVKEGRVVGVGIGAPNGNIYTGEIANAANLPWKGVIPLANLVENHLHLQVTVTNDANAAAVGEMMYGAARGMKDFFMVTLGTGVGSGFVANGQLIYGHDGFAGELGHTIAVRGGRLCGCGRKGCLERYCSATGIVLTAKERMEESGVESTLRKYTDTLSAKLIYEAAVKGDELALDIFDYTAKILGQSLADIVAITSPEAIILFGGLANSGPVLLTPTKKYMEENLLNIFQNKVKIIPSELPNADAAILGASALVW